MFSLHLVVVGMHIDDTVAYVPGTSAEEDLKTLSALATSHERGHADMLCLRISREWFQGELESVTVRVSAPAVEKDSDEGIETCREFVQEIATRLPVYGWEIIHALVEGRRAVQFDVNFDGEASYQGKRQARPGAHERLELISRAARRLACDDGLEMF